MIKSIISGFGRTFGRFLFYLLLGIIFYLLFKDNAFALTYSQNVKYNNTVDIGYRQISTGLFSTQDNTIYINSSLITCNTDNCLLEIPYTYNISNAYEFTTSNQAGINISAWFLIGANGSNGFCSSDHSNIYCTFQKNTRTLAIYLTNIGSTSNLNTSGFQSASINIAIGSSAKVYDIIDNSSTISQIIQNQNTINSNITDSSTVSDTEVEEITDIGIGSDITGNARFSDIVLLAPNVLHHLLIDSNTCVQVNLGQLYNTNLYLPCILPVNYLGTSIWGAIDVIFCIALIIPFIRWLLLTIYKIIGLDRISPQSVFGGVD